MTFCAIMVSRSASVISWVRIKFMLNLMGFVRCHVAALALASVALCVSPAMAIEEPNFTLVVQEGDFEIRDYAPIVAAEVLVDGDRDEAVSAGFRILAGYIFGGNQGNAKIAMTAPVTQSPTDGKGETIAMTAPVTQSAEGASWRVRFMMPSSYTKATLPKPNDDRVTFVDIPARRVAALRFSSMWTDTALQVKKDELAALIKSKHLSVIGEPAFAFYDPPWKPFFWRRNEVMQEIRKR
jgi:hypothetical protein